MEDNKIILTLRRIVKNHQYEKIDGVIIDASSAHAVLQVYDNVNDENKKKYSNLSIDKMVSIAWKLLK